MARPKNKRVNRIPQIIQEIQALLEELTGYLTPSLLKVYSPKISHTPTKMKKRSSLIYAGASGGIRLLLEEGYFDHPKSLPEVTLKLQQEGFNYPRNTISMALLRAVRNRMLVRLPTEGRKGKESWTYAIRK